MEQIDLGGEVRMKQKGERTASERKGLPGSPIPSLSEGKKKGGNNSFIST